MNRKHSQGGPFEDRLLVELKQVVADRRSALAPEEPGPVRRRAWKPGLALAGGVIALGIAFVLPMALDGTGNAAYAVTRQADGTVRVEIHEFEDPDGLQRKLTEEGIQVHVDLPEGKVCDRPFVESGPVLDHETESDGTVVFTLDPADYQGDNYLVIEAEEGGDPIHFYTASGEVPACEHVDVIEPDGPPPGDADHPAENGGEDVSN